MANMMMSLCDFLENERQNLAADRKLYTAQLINRTAALLDGVGHPKTNCLEFARGIVEGTVEEFALNAEPEDPAYQEVLAMYNADKNVESYHFMFIYAPSTSTRVFRRAVDAATGKMVLEYGHTLSFEEDRAKRQQEIQHFRSLAFPSQHYDSARCAAITRECEVQTAADIAQYISEFFLDTSGKIRADGALHAVIVFVGHGSPDGFCLHSQIPMKLDKINQLVLDKLDSARIEIGSRNYLPARVEIIYAQCYAHLYDQAVQCEKFQVFHLTRPGHKETEKTTSIKDTNGLWYIVQLDAEANRLKDQIDNCETMRLDSVNNVAELMNVDENIEQLQGGAFEVADMASTS